MSRLLAENKACTLNVDATVIAEEPKLVPHVAAMRKIIADAIGVSISNISIKATTNEKLGAIGRGEGIAAMAVATVEVGRDRSPRRSPSTAKAGRARRKRSGRPGGPSLPR